MSGLVFAAVMLAFVVVIVMALIKRAKGQTAPTPDPNRFAVGVGHTLAVNGIWLEWVHVYGNGFRVPLSAVSAVTVDKAGWGKGVLRVIGSGAELAKVTDLPLPWAERAQVWIMERLNGQAKGTAK